MGLGLLQFEAVGCQWVWVCCRMPVGLGLLSDASGSGSAVGCQWVWVCCRMPVGLSLLQFEAVGCQWVWVCCRMPVGLGLLQFEAVGGSKDPSPVIGLPAISRARNF